MAAAAAMEDEDVALGIDGDAGGLAHIEVGRKLQRIGDGVVGYFRRRLFCAKAAWLSSMNAATSKRFIKVLP